MSQNSFRVSKVFPKMDQSPLILNFQNGSLKTDNTLECGLYKDKKKKYARRALIEVNDQLYAGDEETDNLCHKFILARNRVTGVARLIEVGTVLAKAVTVDVKIEEVFHQEDNSSKSSTAYNLNKTFGSKKQKRRTEQMLKMSVNISALEGQLLETVEQMDKTSNNFEGYVATNDNSNVYVPAINRQAKHVDDVYKIENILSNEVLSAVKEEISVTDYKNDLVPYIARIAEKKIYLEDIDRSCLLVYADALIKFILSDSKKVVTAKYSACNASPTINKLILNNFLVINGKHKTRPLQMKDKATCYIMVILFLACGYKFDFGTLEIALKRKLANLLRMAGGQLIKDGNDTLACLKLPLPTVSVKRRATRK